jgi:chemotaxis protein MotB
MVGRSHPGVVVNAVEENGQRHEIIIVRRGRGGEEEGHHGGVWKIAFADFMTAMMCFFLVMWLINAANEETRIALASYFNPVKLVDRNSSSKGLQENNAPQPFDNSPQDSEEAPGLAPPSSNPAQDAPDAERRSDAQLFSDPYAVLAEIAADTGLRQNTSSKGDGGAQSMGPATGASGGESYRDPFAPDFWSKQVAVPALDEASPTESETLEAARNPKLSNPAEGADDVEATAKAPPQDRQAEKPFPMEHGVAEPIAQPDAPGTAPGAREKIDAEQERAAAAIRRELARELGSNETLPEGVSVVADERGVVVSVTDLMHSAMFEIGSAVPRREMVMAMEKVAKILSERQGEVIINGHTDGRPFRSPSYDNWRLSTARAHSAYFMLVRGGLDEQRIVEVAGFADRKLKDAEDPFAAANRRIEILLTSGP